MNAILLQELIDSQGQIPRDKLAEFALSKSDLPTYNGYPIHVRMDCPENSLYLITYGASKIEDFGIYMHPKTYSEIVRQAKKPIRKW